MSPWSATTQKVQFQRFTRVSHADVRPSNDNACFTNKPPPRFERLAPIKLIAAPTACAPVAMTVTQAAPIGTISHDIALEQLRESSSTTFTQDYPAEAEDVREDAGLLGTHEMMTAGNGIMTLQDAPKCVTTNNQSTSVFALSDDSAREGHAVSEIEAVQTIWGKNGKRYIIFEYGGPVVTLYKQGASRRVDFSAESGHGCTIDPLV